MVIQFKQVRAMSGAVDPNAIQYTDENGHAWWVPQGHRIWDDIYQPWLAQGNAPLPA